jgi:hypothetical protein
MTCVGLTEQEGKHLLLLVEGDISDVEILNEDISDEEDLGLLEDEGEVVHGQVLELPGANAIGVEVEEISPNVNIDPSVDTDGYEFDSEDNLPLLHFVKRSRRYMKKEKKEVDWKWKKQDLERVDSACDVTFTTAENIETPFEYFKQFFDDDIINNLIDQTYRYSTQKNGTSINTNFSEMYNFLGINIISGIVQMPSYRMFWANETRYPVVADVMPRNRIEKLKSNLHINDNSKMKELTDPAYDKHFKVRPFIDTVKQKFAQIEPEEHNSVDEIMIPFKGQSSLKQYIKNKPHKWGIKVFTRAGVSGIIYEFEVYMKFINTPTTHPQLQNLHG